MSEVMSTSDGTAHPDSPDPEQVRTGVAEVDAVLESLEGLDDSDVAGHAAVFEAAHERLRHALEPDA